MKVQFYKCNFRQEYWEIQKCNYVCTCCGCNVGSLTAWELVFVLHVSLSLFGFITQPARVVAGAAGSFRQANRCT